jgi:hypothetical protein
MNNSGSQTVDTGAGLVWDNVYAALEPHGMNVVGGRPIGVGVTGFTLGGGWFEYSWHGFLIIKNSLYVAGYLWKTN